MDEKEAVGVGSTRSTLRACIAAMAVGADGVLEKITVTLQS